MRLPVPDRVHRTPLLIFITMIFVGQQLLGTDIVFSLLTSVFIALWAYAFNVSGGLYYTSGAFIFFYGLLTVVLGLTVKIILLEPGDSTLQNPDLTMFVYCVTMAGMAVATIVSSGLRPVNPLLPSIESLEQIRTASIVCLVAGWLLVGAFGDTIAQVGSLLTALRQLNRFPYLSIILATTYEVRKSGGKRSLNWVSISGMLISIAFGLLFFSKAGMLIGPTCWVIAAILNGYDFSKLQIVLSALGLAFFSYYLVPYAQYVHSSTTYKTSGNLDIALYYLAHLDETRRLYTESQELQDFTDQPHLFNGREPFLERATILAPDDALISYTNKGHYFGLLPLYVDYANMIPHVIWKNKPSLPAGNRFAYELGLVSEDDVDTGVSFSAASEAFHEAGWLALLLVIPVQMFLAFFVSDSLVGSARYSVWPMLWIMDASHGAPEGGLGVTVYMISYSVIAMLFSFVSLKYVAPFLIRTFTGRKDLSPEFTRAPVSTATVSAATGRLDPGTGGSL